MIITEPRWKAYIVETTKPVFTPEQCQMIINAGRSEPRNTASVGNKQGSKGGRIDTETRTSHISWIPFKKMTEIVFLEKHQQMLIHLCSYVFLPQAQLYGPHPR